MPKEYEERARGPEEEIKYGEEQKERVAKRKRRGRYDTSMCRCVDDIFHQKV